MLFQRRIGDHKTKIAVDMKSKEFKLMNSIEMSFDSFESLILHLNVWFSLESPEKEKRKMEEWIGDLIESIFFLFPFVFVCSVIPQTEFSKYNIFNMLY